MAPRLGAEHLNTAIDDCRGSYQEAQCGGIERRNVIEMHNLCSKFHQTAHAIGCNDDHTESQENEQMGIGEEIDELADGVVWRHLGQQFILMYPAKGQLVACHLHPDRVNGIRRHGLNVSHNNTFVLP